MLKSLTLFAFLCFLQLFAIAQQPVLLVVSEQTGEQRYYQAGDKIGYVLDTDSADVLKWARITKINANSIVLEGDTEVPLAEIKQVESYRMIHYLIAAVTLPLNRIGAVWFAAGTLFFSNGVFNVSEALEPFVTADSYLAGGLVDMSIGLTLMLSPLLLKLVKNKQYKIGEGWKLKVVTGTP